ncbi:MAG: pilin [bacterium]|nr:pilin [bacterium]
MKKIFIFYLMFVFLFIFNITVAKAVDPCTCNGKNFGQRSVEECKELCNTPGSGTTVKLPNPLGTPADTSITLLLGKIINSVMGVIGSLALAMFIYGGAVWMLSGGNQERVAKGKNILIWAAMGLVVIFTSYALVKFILTTITGT